MSREYDQRRLLMAIKAVKDAEQRVRIFGRFVGPYTTVIGVPEQIYYEFSAAWSRLNDLQGELSLSYAEAK